MSLSFDLNEVQTAFAESPADIVFFIGPMGEGKTFAGAISLLFHYERCGVPIRCALIRDTLQNAKISTIPDMQRYFGRYMTLHDDGKIARIYNRPGGKVIIELDIFGVDDPASISKLQGPQYALIWIEEPAPIIDKGNAGVAREVFDIAIARAARQQGTKMRVQVTQNPAYEDHWTEEVANEPDVYFHDEETGETITKAVFRALPGSNKFLPDKTRAANKAAFRNDPGKYARYVKGKAAPVQIGSKVTPMYNPDIHYSPTELQLFEGCPLIFGWDGWHHPACVIGQHVPPNQFVVHDVVQGDGIGVMDLARDYVKPLLNSRKYRIARNLDWRFIGDPTIRTPDQSSVSRSAAQMLEKEFGVHFEPGPTRWDHRYAPLSDSLQRGLSDGRQRIYLSRSARLLHRALNGAWHWKTDNSGKIEGTVPVKDRAADVGDAFSYPVAKLFALADIKKTKPPDRDQSKKLARSYGSSARPSEVRPRQIGQRGLKR